MVTDCDFQKLITIKVYDKTLDLIGRDGCKSVGSRFAAILGSSKKIGILEHSVN